MMIWDFVGTFQLYPFRGVQTGVMELEYGSVAIRKE
jgi:hypothetical protein